MMSARLFQLLGTTARADCRPEHFAQLRSDFYRFQAWDDLVGYAETQRLSPLFFRHAQAAALEIPPASRLQFQGLTLRHAHAARVRQAALAEVLSACAGEGLHPVLLKGAAAAILAYPQAALRPMRDIDLLASLADAPRIQAQLARLGYNAPVPERPGDYPKHLPEAERVIDGVPITIEVHYSLFDQRWRRGVDTQALLDSARPIDVDGLPAATLSLEDMLFHTYTHMLYEQVRLISVADMISIAERYMHEIDWAGMQRRYPDVLSALELFHFLSPLSPELLHAAGLQPSTSQPKGSGEQMQGWPNNALLRWRAYGLGSFLKHTFFPSEWWLRLAYGLGSSRPVLWARWLRHPMQLAYWAVLHLLSQQI
jgi:hypothetical protein